MHNFWKITFSSKWLSTAMNGDRTDSEDLSFFLLVFLFSFTGRRIRGFLLLCWGRYWHHLPLPLASSQLVPKDLDLSGLFSEIYWLSSYARQLLINETARRNFTIAVMQWIPKILGINASWLSKFALYCYCKINRIRAKKVQ